ncbi:hypothetical protein F5Y00DRAFT_270009 [Daldinia vernicosa]|uniref:uncharacterized protein n=1 Tax=Daldinia vernicosa TaxID=114800 RepID=UPI002008404F|nr:uncharacterized protein F5Y00DRAFT_270009 [Daldinia vernicosa]KAI0848807.1 hypothetical protein F5Y00DRAFT_270009 [Daldinia vernicosa]
MNFSGVPKAIKDILDLNVVLDETQELETIVNNIIDKDPTGILSSSKRQDLINKIQWALDVRQKLEEARNFRVFRGSYEQERIKAGINTLKVTEKKMQDRIRKSDRQ